MSAEIDTEEKCLVCTEPISYLNKVTLDKCGHTWTCYTCILKWIERENSCPYCKAEIKFIEHWRCKDCLKAKRGQDDCHGLHKVKSKTQEAVTSSDEEEEVEEDDEIASRVCWTCHESGDESVLLLCEEEGCKQAYHTHCLTPSK